MGLIVDDIVEIEQETSVFNAISNKHARCEANNLTTEEEKGISMYTKKNKKYLKGFLRGRQRES